MQHPFRRALTIALAAGGFLAIGTTAAQAVEDHGDTLVGDVVTDVVGTVPANAPIEVSCNNVTVLGEGAASDCSGGDSASASSSAVAAEPEQSSGTDAGVVGDVVTDAAATAPVNAPVEVSCNNVTVLGDGAASDCSGGDSTSTSSSAVEDQQAQSSGTDEGLVGDVVTDAAATAPVNVPVDVSCNNVTVLGDGGTNECTGAESGSAASNGAVEPEQDRSNDANAHLVGDVVTDAAATAPVNVPVDGSCNNVTVLGHSGSNECSADDTDTAAGEDLTTGGKLGTEGEGSLTGDVTTDVLATVPINATVDFSCTNITILGNSGTNECAEPAYGTDTRAAVSGEVVIGGEHLSLPLPGMAADVVADLSADAELGVAGLRVVLLECRGQECADDVPAPGPADPVSPPRSGEPEEPQPGVPGQPGEPQGPGDPAKPGDEGESNDDQAAPTPGRTINGGAEFGPAGEPVDQRAGVASGARLNAAGYATAALGVQPAQADVGDASAGTVGEGHAAGSGAPPVGQLASTGSEQYPLGALVVALLVLGGVLLRATSRQQT